MRFGSLLLILMLVTGVSGLIVASYAQTDDDELPEVSIIADNPEINKQYHFMVRMDDDVKFMSIMDVGVLLVPPLCESDDIQVQFGGDWDSTSFDVIEEDDFQEITLLTSKMGSIDGPMDLARISCTVLPSDLIPNDDVTVEFSFINGIDDDFFPVDIIGNNATVTVVRPEGGMMIDGDISMAIKHKERVSLVAVKNSGDENIHEVQVKIDEGTIRFVKARGWDRDRIDDSTVMIQTDERPILPASTLVMLLIVDNKESSYEWSALDSSGNVVGTGRATAR